MTEFTVDLNLTGPSRVVLRDEVVRESRSLAYLNEHEANMHYGRKWEKTQIK